MTPILLTGAPQEQGGEIMRILHHALDHKVGGLPAPFTNFGLMVLLGAVLLAIIVLFMDTRSPVPRGAMRNFFEGLLLFVRDEMTRPTMGRKYGDAYAPFFCTTFLFILTLNLLGMIPIHPELGGTATSSYMVTGALAACVLVLGIGSGLKLHGPAGYLKTFIPGGVPGWLVPLLFVLELMGYCIKHSVLMVRLYANMLAGHLVLGSFIGLIFVARSYLVAPPSIGMALFVSSLEILVALIQAYVFTLLSVLFVGGVVRPEH